MLRKKWLPIGAALCLAWLLPLATPSAHAKPKTLTIAADVWCPINCAANDEKPGIGIELAKNIFEPLGYQVNYVVMPWARALEEVKAGRVDAVVGAAKADGPTLLYPSHPICHIMDDFYVLNESPVRFQGIPSLQGLRIGIITGYAYHESVMRFLGKARKTPGLVQETGGDDALEQNIRKLMAGRIDVIIESSPVMNYTLARLKLENKIKRIGGVPQGNVYLAFSPALAESKERLHQYDAGIARLKKADVLKTLYTSYKLHP